MRTFKAALFDLDGTLIDTENQYTEIWGGIARRFRPDVPDLEYRIKGTTLTQILDTYFPEPGMRQEVVGILVESEARMVYEFFPGALDFIADIRAHGVKCAVVTSSDQKKMGVLRKAMPGFDDIFDRVLTSEDFAASKPNPDCYMKGMAAFGLTASECVVFEDAFTGLAAGMASGCFTVGLATFNPAELLKDKCHHVVSSFVGLDYDGVVRLLS
ncbi:MAG: HAD family phosphatase [Bacteroidaceae bacterium]|nr:HAD family phosphatase [Bacteroidaceae bacterium]